MPPALPRHEPPRVQPSSPHSQFRRRRLQALPALPALLAWLLLSIQVPWHAGMQAGSQSPDYARLASSLGIACGPAPDATTLATLVAAGLVDPAQLPAHDGDGSLCELFTGLVAPLAVAGQFTAAELPPVRAPAAYGRASLPAFLFRQPPARAPPAFLA